MQRHATLEAATAWCFEQAQPGDAVLLSPACASLDMFRNYGHRAEVFVPRCRRWRPSGGAWCMNTAALRRFNPLSACALVGHTREAAQSRRGLPVRDWFRLLGRGGAVRLAGFDQPLAMVIGPWWRWAW
jgi:hypothetical protein